MSECLYVCVSECLVAMREKGISCRSVGLRVCRSGSLAEVRLVLQNWRVLEG